MREHPATVSAAICAPVSCSRVETLAYLASGLNLITAAIALWNTVYLERATTALQGHGREVDTSLLQYLSPLGWEHINLTGDYVWRSSAKIGAGKFRPLRPLSGA